MIPLATTTITILRQSVAAQYDEPYTGDSPDVRREAATGIRAVIDRPTGRTGREKVAGGEQNIVELLLVCDPCDLDYRDLVRDDRTTIVYRVVWVLHYTAHLEGGLQLVSGEV